MYRKNTAGQFVCVQLLLTATGAIATGLSPTVRRCIDGTFAAGGGTVTEDGSTGSYKYAMAQADTNGNDVSLVFTATGAMPVAINFVTTAADPTDGVRFGLTALPNAAASAVGGLPLAVDTSGRVDVLKINGTSQTARDIGASVITASGTVTTVTGSVGSVTGAVGSVTGSVGSVTGAVGSVTGAVGSVTGLTASNLDTTVSSRLAGGSYTAPDNASITGIKTQTDKMAFTVANKIDANVLAVNGDTTSAASLAKTTRAIGRGTVSGSPSVTSIPTSAFAPAGSVADQFKGRIITFDADTTTAALRGQATDITANTSSATPTFTVTALTTSPAVGDTFSVT